jgi:hypothetical protein
MERVSDGIWREETVVGEGNCWKRIVRTSLEFVGKESFEFHRRLSGKNRSNFIEVCRKRIVRTSSKIVGKQSPKLRQDSLASCKLFRSNPSVDLSHDTSSFHFNHPQMSFTSSIHANYRFSSEPQKNSLHLTPFESNFIYYATSLNVHIRVNTLDVSKILLIIQFNIYSPSINRVEKSQKPENEPA